MKVIFLGGPCDGAETLLEHPLPGTIRADGPVDDAIAELLGHGVDRETGEVIVAVQPDSATYHLVSCAGNVALYVVAFNAPVPDGVVYDRAEMNRLRPPGARFDRPL